MGLFRGFGGLEGLKLSEFIYTPRGRRPRRIQYPSCFDHAGHDGVGVVLERVGPCMLGTLKFHFLEEVGDHVSERHCCMVPFSIDVR